MKTKIILGFIGLITLTFGFAFVQESKSEKTKILDTVFMSDRIKITIPHHGGYAATNLGNAVMEIKRHSTDSLFSVLYKDAIDRRKLAFTIDDKEYAKLKSIFIKLIAIHQSSKSLSGDCLTIDKNYILKSKDNELIIKPDKASKDFDCLDQWIYSKELNN